MAAHDMVLRLSPIKSYQTATVLNSVSKMSLTRPGYNDAWLVVGCCPLCSSSATGRIPAGLPTSSSPPHWRPRERTSGFDLISATATDVDHQPSTSNNNNKSSNDRLSSRPLAKSIVSVCAIMLITVVICPAWKDSQRSSHCLRVVTINIIIKKSHATVISFIVIQHSLLAGFCYTNTYTQRGTNMTHTHSYSYECAYGFLAEKFSLLFAIWIKMFWCAEREHFQPIVAPVYGLAICMCSVAYWRLLPLTRYLPNLLANDLSTGRSVQRRRRGRQTNRHQHPTNAECVMEIILNTRASPSSSSSHHAFQIVILYTR